MKKGNPKNVKSQSDLCGLKVGAEKGTTQATALTASTADGAITLKVNGVVKQNANLNQMSWSVAEQISKLSQAFELKPGDIILRGTPENVGPVGRGPQRGG